MGLTLWFLLIPTPRRPDYPDHRLPAGVHVHVLNGHLLLALAAVPVERFNERRIGAGELVRLGEVLSPALERLLADHSAPVAFHRRVMCGDQLRRHHPFQLVLRSNASQRRDGCVELFIPCFSIGGFEPKCLDGLVGEDVVPVI